MNKGSCLGFHRYLPFFKTPVASVSYLSCGISNSDEKNMMLYYNSAFSAATLYHACIIFVKSGVGCGTPKLRLMGF